MSENQTEWSRAETVPFDYFKKSLYISNGNNGIGTYEIRGGKRMALKYNYNIKEVHNRLVLCKGSEAKGILMHPIDKKHKDCCIRGVEKEINDCISEKEADTKVAEFCLL